MTLYQANSKKQGDVGLGAAIAWATRMGYTVCLPLTDSQAYDLIIDDGNPQRVQVKTSRYKRGGVFKVSLSTQGGNQSWSGVSKKFDAALVDYVFILTEEGDNYYIPAKMVPITSLSLGPKYQAFRV